MPTLIEIKAKCDNPHMVREVLTKRKARFVGEDHQIDTYFKVPSGRLKLREGNIEKTLIFYQRNNQTGPKKSEVLLYRPEETTALRKVLEASLGILTVVDKKREIYFIDNVKFHIDTVKNLGSFIEIEAIDEKGDISEAILLEQCRYYMTQLGVEEDSLVENSYSDMLLQ